MSRLLAPKPGRGVMADKPIHNWGGSPHTYGGPEFGCAQKPGLIGTKQGRMPALVGCASATACTPLVSATIRKPASTMTLLAEKWTTFVLGARKSWDDRDVAVTQAPRFAIMGPEPRPSYPRSLPT